MYASLIDKFVGHRYGGTGLQQPCGTGLQQPFGGYATTNFATSYTFAEGLGALKSIKVGLQFNNLFDNKRVYCLSGYTAQDTTPLYFTIPARSYELTFSAKL